MATEIDLQTNPAVNNHYRMLCRRGFSHEDALRLAHGHLVNVVGTDTQIMGTDDGFANDNRSRQIFRKKCAAAGVTPTGKYFGQLCRPGVTLDPFAQASDTGEIKKKLRMLGRGCEGSINVPAPEAPPAPAGPYRVADDLVEKAMSETIRKEKIRLNPKERAQLRAQIREEITPLV